MKKNDLTKLLNDNGADKKAIDMLLFDINGDYINLGKMRTDERGNYLPTPYTERKAYNNLKRTLLRELLKTYKPDDPVVIKVMEELP